MRHAPSLIFLALGLVACGQSNDASPSDAGVSRDASEGARDSSTSPLTGASDGGTDATLAPGAPDASDGAVSSDAGTDSAAAIEANTEADQAVEAMLLAFWSPSQQYLLATQGTTTATGYWTYQQAWDAVLDAVGRHHGARFTGTLATFYETQNAVGWSRDYYDDENWATLALIRAYDLTGTAAYLAEAETLYADIMAGWDTTCCGSPPGGVWWDRAHTQKATASNAGPALSGALLYARTQNASYLTFAEQVYAFWLANMVDPTTHQVIDHITSAGQKVAWKFTYNEGLMIGASVALAQVGADAGASAAEPIAAFMLASETETSDAGLILTDGTNAGCTGDCMQFKGIGARYLTALAGADPTHPEYASLVSRSATAAWSIARDPASGLFGTDWGAAFVAPGQLDSTSSAAMTLSAAATLVGDPPADPAGVYEAEESVLHSVGLEAIHGAFDGWGYVAGWNADGQSIDFLVSAPTAGSYDLTFRFAAGAGDASRVVSVNGATAAANQAFASTGSWDTYATVTVTTSLVAGANTISVAYDSSSGSASYLNLDRLSIALH